MTKFMKIIWSYEWLKFIRNKIQIALLFTVFLFGVYAILSGNAFIHNQKKTIKNLNKKELTEFNGYISSFQKEPVSSEDRQLVDLASKPEYAWFRHGYHVITVPHDYAKLAIGQRDIVRFYYRLTGMNLHYQLYQNEIANPYYLMIGSLDLSFVIIYIIPLLIIVFTYSLYSGELDSGVLNLLQSQKPRLANIILARLFFYFTLIVSLVIILSLLGFIVSGNILSIANIKGAIAWLLVITGYCVFWFGVMWLIIGLHCNSSLNAIMAVGSWVLVIVVIPAIFTISLDYTYPLNNIELAELTRRTGLEDENDIVESRKVILEFFEYRPEYAVDSSEINENLMAKAYAAFTVLKERDSQELVDSYNKTIITRARKAAKLRYLNPAANIQETLSLIAQSDLSSYLKFQAELADFHHLITDFYFRRLFKNEELTLEDYSDRPSFKQGYIEVDWTQVVSSFLALFLLGGGLFFIGLFVFNIKKEDV